MDYIEEIKGLLDENWVMAMFTPEEYEEITEKLLEALEAHWEEFDKDLQKEADLKMSRKVGELAEELVKFFHVEFRDGNGIRRSDFVPYPDYNGNKCVEAVMESRHQSWDKMLEEYKGNSKISAKRVSLAHAVKRWIEAVEHYYKDNVEAIRRKNEYYQPSFSCIERSNKYKGCKTVFEPDDGMVSSREAERLEMLMCDFVFMAEHKNLSSFVYACKVIDWYERERNDFSPLFFVRENKADEYKLGKIKEYCKYVEGMDIDEYMRGYDGITSENFEDIFMPDELSFAPQTSKSPTETVLVYMIHFKSVCQRIAEAVEPHRKEPAEDRKPGRPPILFDDCIVEKEKAENIKRTLRSLLIGKRGKGACIVFFACYELHWITEPSPHAIDEEFGIKEEGVKKPIREYFHPERTTHSRGKENKKNFKESVRGDVEAVKEEILKEYMRITNENPHDSKKNTPKTP